MGHRLGWWRPLPLHEGQGHHADVSLQLASTTQLGPPPAAVIPVHRPCTHSPGLQWLLLLRLLLLMLLLRNGQARIEM